MDPTPTAQLAYVTICASDTVANAAAETAPIRPIAIDAFLVFIPSPLFRSAVGPTELTPALLTKHAAVTHAYIARCARLRHRSPTSAARPLSVGSSSVCDRSARFVLAILCA